MREIRAAIVVANAAAAVTVAINAAAVAAAVGKIKAKPNQIQSSWIRFVWVCVCVG